MLEDMNTEEIKFGSVEDFLTELKREFEEGNNKSAKVAELKKIEQESRMIEKLVQKFRKAARRSEYEEVKKFER